MDGIPHLPRRRSDIGPLPVRAEQSKQVSTTAMIEDCIMDLLTGLQALLSERTSPASNVLYPREHASLCYSPIAMNLQL